MWVIAKACPGFPVWHVRCWIIGTIILYYFSHHGCRVTNTWSRLPADLKRSSGVPVSPQVPLSASMSPVRLHSSNPNLCAELVDFQPPVSRLTDSVECASDYIKLQEEFCTIAQKGRQVGSTRDWEARGRNGDVKKKWCGSISRQRRISWCSVWHTTAKHSQLQLFFRNRSFSN